MNLWLTQRDPVMKTGLGTRDSGLEKARYAESAATTGPSQRNSCIDCGTLFEVRVALVQDSGLESRCSSESRVPSPESRVWVGERTGAYA